MDLGIGPILVEFRRLDLTSSTPIGIDCTQNDLIESLSRFLLSRYTS
jgi:hypothetical protein